MGKVKKEEECPNLYDLHRPLCFFSVNALLTWQGTTNYRAQIWFSERFIVELPVKSEDVARFNVFVEG